jgi:hypothetical protein
MRRKPYPFTLSWYKYLTTIIKYIYPIQLP